MFLVKKIILWSKKMGHIFEAVMLICFGFSWPINVVKAYKAKTTKGTSIAFIILIITGYLAGITAKFLNGQINYVLAVYFINLAIVMVNIFVYIRNHSLDKKREQKITKDKILAIQEKYKNNTKSYSKEDNMNYQELNGIAQKNAVILLGGTLDKTIPVTELSESFSFNFKFYNRSEDNLSILQAKEFFQTNVKLIQPEGIILHLGDEDITLFQSNPSSFDKAYLDLLYEIKSSNKKIRIAVAGVYNPNSTKIISDMNRHIKAIADSEKVTFINLDNVKLWNPKGTKAASSFARNMGLNIRKPLNDVAEIIYSYAYLEATPVTNKQTLVG